MIRRFAAALFILVMWQSVADAGEVYLKNGDRITGKIIDESGASVTIESEAMGMISVNKGFIERVIGDVPEEQAEVVADAEEAEEAVWERKITAGYTISRGNTENQQLVANAIIRRTTDNDEFTLKGDLYYSAADKETEAEKWSGMGRYDWKFDPDKRWFNFYQLQAERDRFAEVNYRLIPGVGLGYWFFDREDMRFKAEVAVGLEHTDYRDGTEDTSEMVLIPKAYFERNLFVNSKLIQDVTLYPSLTDTGDYRLHSETTLENPLSDKLSVNFTLINDYNSDPPENARTNDTRFISSLSYSF